jgi:hypothetical protein
MVTLAKRRNKIKKKGAYYKPPLFHVGGKTTFVIYTKLVQVQFKERSSQLEELIISKQLKKHNL